MAALSLNVHLLLLHIHYFVNHHDYVQLNHLKKIWCFYSSLLLIEQSTRNPTLNLALQWFLFAEPCVILIILTWWSNQYLIKNTLKLSKFHIDKNFESIYIKVLIICNAPTYTQTYGKDLQKQQKNKRDRENRSLFCMS